MLNSTSKAWVVAIALLAGTSAVATAQTQNAGGRSDSTSTTAMNSAGPMKSGGLTGRDLAISAAKSANHTILFRALRVSGLTEQAAGKGPFTVFAPTNEAFEKLPAGTLDKLLQPAGKQQLIKLLAYHVVKGKLTAEQLQDGQKLKTVAGGTLTVGKQGGTVTITDDSGNVATVNYADIEATNGIIHSVDTVLTPTARQ